VTHFYELFLHEYDRKLKVQRGVFYTPQPVVSYIVRSVHELLQTEFGLAEGLAETTTWGEMLKKHPGLRLPPLTNEPGEERTISPDEPFVQILDPATGTATFLVEAIDVIHRTLVAKWKRERLTDADQRAAWNDYVPRHLLPRLHAFELMMAPYAIAHMKVGLKLAETGYRFGTEERARIYLTNALEPWVKQLPLIGVDALAHEAAAVNEIKRHKRFTVVIGNPPYARDSRNRSTFIEKLMDRYKAAVRDERNLQPLGDDCIKFICLGHASVENSGAGVLSYISNNKYLSGATIHRGIREELAKTFDSIQITNLHGDVGHPTDRNVFAIREGVTIATFARRLESASARSVRYREVFGAAEMKCAALLAPQTLSSWTALPIVPPQFFFIPTSSEHASDLDSAISVAEMFGNGSTTDKGTRWGNGVKTNRDDLLIADTRRELTARFAAFEDATLSDAELADRFALTDGPYWETARERQKVLNGEWRTKVLPYCYRPFSNRWILYLTNLMEIGRGGASKHVMKHMMHPNLGLVTHRTASKQLDYTHFFAVNALIDVRTFPDREGVPYLFPLYVYPDGSSQATLAGMQDERRPNLSRTFLSRLSNALRLPPSGNLGLPHGLTPEDIFHYAYAVFHSPGYRSRYAEFLKIDFPRLPLTGNLELFRALARLGGELTALHLLESTKLAQPITAFIGGPKNGHGPEVETISWSRSTVWVDKAQTTGFQGVREDVWNFHIGGYQVCEKWLKDRKGRTLSKDDIAHYQKIVVALAETIRLMKEIDEVIERHGGWPGGFEQGAVEAQALEAAEKTEHYRT
jgi:predicted helicase